jgi:hypothetical protein
LLLLFPTANGGLLGGSGTTKRQHTNTNITHTHTGTQNSIKNNEHIIHNEYNAKKKKEKKKVKLSPNHSMEAHMCVSCGVRTSSTYKTVKLSPLQALEAHTCVSYAM